MTCSQPPRCRGSGARATVASGYATPNPGDPLLRLPKLAALAASAAVALGAAAIVPAANASVDAHTYRITTQGSLALDVSGGSHGDGAAVIQWPVNYGANQSWQVVNLPDGYQQLRNVNSGKCLTLGYPGAPGNAGTGITQWVCGSSANQEWSID